MSTLRWLVPIAVVMAANPGPSFGRKAGFQGLVGVAMQAAGKVCFSINSAALQPHTFVTIIGPGEPFQSATAEITRPGKNCPGMPPGTAGYKLRAVTGHLEDNTVLFGVLGTVQVLSHGDGTAVRLNAVQQTVTLRSCTSTDGVHLSIWNSPAPAGARLWHRYVYLGQDLDASCSAAESAE